MMGNNMIARATAVDPASLKWTLDHASTTEGQTFYITPASGGYMILQMVYSTMSWSPNVQISARYYGPSGEKHFQTFNCYGTSMKLSDEGCSATCEQMSVKMSSRDPLSYKLSYNAGAKMMADLELVSCTGGAIAIAPDNGKVLFKSDATAGSVSSRFVPRAQVKGTLIVEGKLITLDGFGAIVHAVQHYPQCVGRWNFVNMQGERDSLLIYQFEMPDGYDDQHKSVSQLCWVRDNEVRMISLDNFVKQENKTMDSASGYLVPGSVSLSSSGKTASGQSVSMNFDLSLTQSLDMIDVLSELPFLVRKFIQTFITKPFLYSWIQDVSFEVKEEEEQVAVVSGKMFVEASFLVEMD